MAVRGECRHAGVYVYAKRGGFGCFAVFRRSLSLFCACTFLFVLWSASAIIQRSPFLFFSYCVYVRACCRSVGPPSKTKFVVFLSFFLCVSSIFFFVLFLYGLGGYLLFGGYSRL